jgi:hypothetical protein
MGIYLGNVGNIEVSRFGIGETKQSVVNPADVNATRNRFSFDFDSGFLATGDFIQIKATDNTLLSFISSAGWVNGIVQSSGNWYIYVDELGGIQLYNNFDRSLEGGADGRVSLVTLTRNIPIDVRIMNMQPRLLGDVTEYELNTNRETVDITTLTDQHRQQFSSLISGSGRLTAQWDYVATAGHESVQYLMHLVVRTEVGSSFTGKFYLKYPNTISQSGKFKTSQLDDSLWWEFEGLVVSSAVSFSPDQVVFSTIDFVTTGPIRLRSKTT